MSFLKKIFHSGWFIPGTVVVFGGLFIANLGNATIEIEFTENKIQTARHDILHENSSVRFGYAFSPGVPAESGQAPVILVKAENMYPSGNPPYRDFIAEADKKKVKNNHRKILDANSNLEEELSVLRKARRKRKVNLPRSLDNPVKRHKHMRILAHTYKLFNKDIDVASRVVQEAMEQGSRTEEEINEALEAIEQMKGGRRMLIERIQLLEATDQEDIDVEESSDEFMVPEEE